MLFLLLAFETPMPPPTGDRTSHARAVVRIARPQVVNEKTWDEAPPERKKELTVRSETGTRVKIRVIEFE